MSHIRALNEIAAGRGQTLAQMALAWTLRDPRVTSTLIGASSVAQLEANVGALDRLGFDGRRAGRDRAARRRRRDQHLGGVEQRLSVSEVVTADAVAEPYSGRTAWGRNLETPLREFLRTETGSAAVLLGATLAALVWVNVDASSYASLWATDLSIHVGSHGISQDLRGWVNTGLMTFFFFVVGLEARREFDMGELRERRRFAIPLFAGLGGMVVPVAIFLAFNAGKPSAHGWGTAMSTDTAFALGLLALVGSHFPSRLRAFLLTVSVVDDVLALGVIAVFYSENVAVRALLIAFGILAVILVVRAARIHYGFNYHGLVYFVLCAAMWVAMFESGVDPVVVGLLAGSADVRVPRDARRPRAGERPLPDLPRAADAGAGARGEDRARGRDLAERAPAAALPPVDELRDRAAVRARQRRNRHQRRLPRACVHVADHARDPLRLPPRQAERHRRRRAAHHEADPREAAAAGRVGDRRGRRLGGGDRVHRLDPHRDARLRRHRARGGEARRSQRGASARRC